jgi:hypothetical protein
MDPVFDFFLFSLTSAETLENKNFCRLFFFLSNSSSESLPGRLGDFWERDVASRAYNVVVC